MQFSREDKSEKLRTHDGYTILDGLLYIFFLQKTDPDQVNYKARPFAEINQVARPLVTTDGSRDITPRLAVLPENRFVQFKVTVGRYVERLELRAAGKLQKGELDNEIVSDAFVIALHCMKIMRTKGYLWR